MNFLIEAVATDAFVKSATAGLASGGPDSIIHIWYRRNIYAFCAQDIFCDGCRQSVFSMVGNIHPTLYAIKAILQAPGLLYLCFSGAPLRI